MNILEEVRRVAAEADCLYATAAVEAALDRMAEAISLTLAERNPVVVTVLTGGVITAGRLLPRLHFPLEVDSIKAGRYQGETRGTDMRWQLEPTVPLAGRVVLVIDDILDEGITLTEIRRRCIAQGAAEVYLAVLVDKQLGREKPCRADFVGLAAENRYLFGYGMDYKGYLRNWPGIYACKTVY